MNDVRINVFQINSDTILVVFKSVRNRLLKRNNYIELCTVMPLVEPGGPAGVIICKSHSFSELMGQANDLIHERVRMRAAFPDQGFYTNVEINKG